MRHVGEPLDELVVMHARTVIVDFRHLDAHDELCAWIRRHQCLILLDAGDTLNAKSPLRHKVNEQQPDIRILAEIAHGLVFAIAVVVWKSKRPLTQDAHETWITAFIRACRQSPMITGCQEEHIGTFNECSGRIVNPISESRYAAVGFATGVKAILEVAVPIVVIMDTLRHRCSP